MPLFPPMVMVTVPLSLMRMATCCVETSSDLLTAKFLKAGTVVTPVTSNSGLETALEGKVLRTRVGSPYVISAMQEALQQQSGPVVGFEANGGFLTMSPITINGSTLPALPTRDCFLPIMATLLTAAKAGMTMSQLASSMNMPVALSGLIRDYETERSKALLAHLRSSPEALANFMSAIGKVRSVDNTDGLRMTLDDGSIVHLRPSGNAPEFRCYVEANSEIKSIHLLKITTQSVARMAL